FFQVLREALAQLIEESNREVSGREDTSPGDAADAESGIGDVISAEVSSELEAMISSGDRNVIHELPLGDISALRKRRLFTAQEVNCVRVTPGPGRVL